MSEWISNFLQDDHPYYNDADYDDTNYLSENDPMPGGDSDGFYDDNIGDVDGLLESLIIIGLAGALIFLIYYRQQHQNAHRQGEAARGQADAAPVDRAAQEQQQQDDRGVFPQPGDPEFGQWAAGGVGH